MNSQYSHWQQAYEWGGRRRSAGLNASVWFLRYQWPSLNCALFNSAHTGGYRLSAMQVNRNRKSSGLQWSAQDALVLKCASLEVAHLLPKHPRCAHVKVHGGARQSVEQMGQALLRGDYASVSFESISRVIIAIFVIEQLILHVSAHVTDLATLVWGAAFRLLSVR